jgi:pyruvate dehydrogenase E2 component (dihydrolipoamide acetyltransferase)
MSYEFKLPDLGEGLTEAEIVKWRVKEGDTVKEDDPLVEVLTEKANIEIPSPVAGRVARIAAQEGERVRVGQLLVVIETEEAARPSLEATPKREEAARPGAPTPTIVRASPAARRLARELNVQLDRLVGTGPGGIITEEDVRRAAGLPTAPPQVQERARPELLPTPPPSPLEERIPIRGIRRRIAERLTRAHLSTAMVTHVEEVDFTRLVEIRERLKQVGQERGVRVTYLPLIMKLMVPALKKYPLVNSTVDEERGEIVVHKVYNIGIATDTPQGLIVPVVKDVDKKDVFQLAAEIEALSEKARRGEITLEEIRGGTVTITNIGSVGGIFATPILNYPEAAILGIGRIHKRPIYRGGEVRVADVAYLFLTFDHRVFDGVYAAQFTSLLASYIENPGLLLFEAHDKV